MKKIYAALSALMLCLIAIPLAVFSAESSSSTYELTDAGRGYFVGGSAQVGTNVPRTWRNTAGVEITLSGVTTNRQQQFALGGDNSFLMNGIFTVTVPAGVTVSEAEIIFYADNNHSPELRFPASSEKVVATSADPEAPHSAVCTFDTPVTSFDFSVSGNDRIRVKKIRLTHTGTISGGGSSSSASDVTINATAENGSGIKQGTSDFFCEWRSNDNITPTFSIVAGGRKNNMKTANGHIVAYVGREEVGKTYTVSAGSSHYISSIKISVKDFDANGSVNITLGGKQVVPGSSEQTLEASFTEGTDATFRLDGSNKGIEFTRFEITATPKGQKPGQKPSTGGETTIGEPEEFKTTTIVNGTFAPGTQWYAITNNIDKTANGKKYVLFNTSGEMVLDKDIAESTGADSELWCVVGNATDGYTIYNKAAGTSKALAAATPISNNTLVMVGEIGDANCTVWDLTKSTAPSFTDKPGYFIAEHGKAANKMNRNGVSKKLSFWTGGADDGSSFLFHPVTISGGNTPDPGTTTGSIVIDNPAAGSFAGGSDDRGTATPRTWQGTVSGQAATISLVGGNNAANKRFGAYTDGGFVICGNFTITLPESVKIKKISTVTKRIEGGTPTIYIPDANNNSAHTTHNDDAEHTTEYTLTTPSNTVNFSTGGSAKHLNLKSITLECDGLSGGQDPVPGTATTIKLDVNNGEKVSGSQNSANYCRGWRSNTTPQITLLCDRNENNMDRRTTDHFLLHSGSNTNSSGWTISVPDGYVITDLSMDYRMHGNAASTVTFGGQNYTGTASDQKLTLTGNNTNEVKFTTNDSNGGVEMRNITVTVKSGSGQPVGPDVPEEGFKTTELVNGEFAENTPWYAMTIGAADLTIANNGDEEYIALGANDISTSDKMMWCITGNETDGYTIYNKEAGTGMSLAAPIEMKGTTGAESYAILKAPGDAEYCYKWDITNSTALGSKTAYFLAEHGESAKKLNNRGNRLAFWTGGADSGSSIRFIAKEDVPVRPETLEAPYIFPYTGESFYTIKYRIPSISVVGGGKHAGRIIAFNDYRYSGSDIGMGNNGRIDQHYTYSDDGGKTWTHPGVLHDAAGNPVSQGKGTHPQKTDPYEYADNAFSDPCSVADRESGRVLLMSCAGPMGFWSSRRNSPQLVARWYSEDGGDTWSAPDYDVTEQLFRPLDGKAYNGQGADGFFIGSGKIHQSRHVKVGKYYRLYMAISTHCQGANTKNYVYFSDDFGENWHLLGDAAKGAVDSNGDEPKVEELPDGSVAIIARGNGGNRNYNIFTFTDIKGGYGSWGNYANRNILGSNLNACNGEPMMVPAVNKATGKKCYVLLQSVPFGPGRANVGIAYKEISNIDHCGTPEALGENWLGKLQVSTMGSAYSTMAQMTDGNIAFLYEEETHGRAYTGVFRKFSLSEITGGKYEYTPDPDGAISKEIAGDLDILYSQKKALYEPWLTMEAGTLVGQPTAATIARIRPLAKAYLESRSLADLKALEDALVTTEIIGITDGVKYRMTNVERTPTRYLTVSASNQLEGTTEESDACDFEFVPVDPAARAGAALESFLLRHVKTGRYAAATGANETRIEMVETADEAAVYSALLTTDGRTAIICTQPTGGNNALHLAGDNTRVVPWTAAETSPASRWYVAPENPEDATVTGIENVIAAPEGNDEAVYDLYGRRVNATRPGQIYISKGRKFIAR